MVSKAELILRVITLCFLVLSQFFSETVWVSLKFSRSVHDICKQIVSILSCLSDLVLRRSLYFQGQALFLATLFIFDLGLHPTLLGYTRS